MKLIIQQYMETCGPEPDPHVPKWYKVNQGEYEPCHPPTISEPWADLAAWRRHINRSANVIWLDNMAAIKIGARQFGVRSLMLIAHRDVSHTEVYAAMAKHGPIDHTPNPA